MKNSLVRVFLAIITLSLFYALPSYAADAADAAEAYKFDPNHTSVVFHVSHFGFSYPSGKWSAEGDLVLDEAKPKNSKVDVTIKTATVDTGIPKLDEHLRSKEFFDVEQFPTATFVSDKVTVTGKDKAKVHGLLTMHGVSKPVTLNVKLNKVGINPKSNKKTAGFTASTSIKRSDFGMTTYAPAIGDEVKIDIEAEAQKV